MRRATKRQLSTAVGVVVGAVTFTGPAMGAWLNDWQHRRGICGCWRCENSDREAMR